MLINYIILTLLLIYFISLILYILGNIINSKPFNNNNLEPISVIVAVKNGALSLPNILNDLENQNYEGAIEYIIVDDQSVDNSKDIIKKIENNNNNFKYVSSKDGNPKLNFKKRALDAGINKSNFNILLFTDVDCRLKKTWVTAMVKAFNADIDYVIGVSKIDKTHNIITWFQKIDLMMLFSVSRGMCNLNIPFASIGQNQAYKKDLYEKIGFMGISDSIQGDDTLFLQLCVKQNIKVIFNDDPKSFVDSRKEKNLLPFIKQRVRWAADLKVMWNYNKILFMISLSTFMTNLIIIILLIDYLILKIFNYGEILFLILFLKMILELFLFMIGRFKLKININLFDFIYWFILQIPYVIFMGIGSFFIQFIGWRKR